MPDIKEKLVELLYKQKGYTLPIWTAPQTIEIMVDALIANGVTFQEWISVEERLPEYGEKVIAGDTIEDYVGIATLQKDKFGDYWLWRDTELEFGEFTHWMPLPQPPKGE